MCGRDIVIESGSLFLFDLGLPKMDSATGADKEVISPSLLRPWDWDFCYQYNPEVGLGMNDWMVDEPLELDTVLQEKDNIDLPSCESGEPHSNEVLSPSPKRPRKCLSPPPKPICVASKPLAWRFGSPVSVNTYRKAAEGVVSANMQFNTMWAEIKLHGVGKGEKRTSP